MDFDSPAKAEGDLRAPPEDGAYQPGKIAQIDVKLSVRFSYFFTMADFHIKVYNNEGDK